MSTEPVLPRPLEFHEFEPLKGQTFLADCNPRPVPLELVDVHPVRLTGSIMRPQFTLIFRSAPSAFLVAGIYTMRCGLFGPESIYIEPINAALGETRSGHYYQAAFS